MKKNIDEVIRACSDQNDDMYLCVLPFFHLFSDSNGKWGLCCKAETFEHTVNTHTTSQHFRHEIMDAIRREMVTGKLDLTKQYCRKCIEGEEKGLISFRQGWNQFILSHGNAAKNPILNTILDVANEEAFESFPNRRILDVKIRIFGNQCNLSCFMCAPENSSTRVRELKKIRKGYWFSQLGEPASARVFKDMSAYEDFVDDIVALLPFIRSIRIIGGEPFLLKNHFTFLDTVVESGHSKDIILTYHTNLTKFNIVRSRVANYFEQFARINLFISLDGHGAKNDYIRAGSDFAEVLDNIHFFRALSVVEMKIYATVSILNAGEVVDIIDYYENSELGIPVEFNMVTGPTILRAQHLPEEIKAVYLERIRNSPYADRCEATVRMLELPQVPRKFNKFLEYIGDLDEFYGRNLLDLWPEFAPYYVPPKGKLKGLRVG